MIELNHHTFPLIGEPGVPRIVRAGEHLYVLSDNAKAVMRLLPDGSPDLSFDGDALAYLMPEGLLPYHVTESNGMVTVYGTVPAQSQDQVQHKSVTFPVTGRTGAHVTVADLPNLSGFPSYEATPDQAGNLYRTGYSIAGGSMTPILMRTRPDGSSDTTYSSTATEALTSAGLFAESLLPDDDGGLYICGSVKIPADYTNNTPERFVGGIARLLPSGELDRSFGQDGLVLTPNDTHAADIARTADGDLLVGLAGETAVVMKLDASGAPVSGFGNAGLDTIDLNGSRYGAEYVQRIVTTGNHTFAVVASYPKHTLTIVPIGESGFVTDGMLQITDNAVGENTFDVVIDAESQTLQLAFRTWDLNGIRTVALAYGDRVPPQLLAADVVGELADRQITLDFSEPIEKGSGSITLRMADGSVAALIDVADADVTVAGAQLKLQLPRALYLGRYEIELAYGAVKDLQGNGVLSDTGASFDVEIGSISPDTAGSSANDQFANSPTEQVIDGAAGKDAFASAGNRADYDIIRLEHGFLLRHRNDGSIDTLLNVERLHFDDFSVALDSDGVAGQAYRIYRAAFARTPDEGGLGFWIGMMDKGVSLQQVAQGFAESPEFAQLYAASTTAELVQRLYSNVLGRQADIGGSNFWVDVLSSGRATLGEVLAGFSESTENTDALAPIIGGGFPYLPFGGS